MKFHHKIISIFDNLFTFDIYKKNLRILTFHHIKKENFLLLKKRLLFLKKKYHFLTPKEFFNIANKKKQLTKNSILLTFDDGYYSQKKFAEEILEKINIKAIFFVVPNFFKLRNFNKSRQFIKKNINNNLSLNEISFDMRNMSISDISKLKKKGHFIGIHTLNHKKLSDIQNIKKLSIEIFSNKNNYTNLLGAKNFCFAYPFGDITSINQKSLKIINKHYNFVFSGIRGNNYLNYKNLFWRDAIDDNFDSSLISMFLKGFIDIYYFRDRKKIKSYL